MNLQFCYGTRVTVLPSAVAAHIDKATKKDIRILFALAEAPTADVAAVAAAAGVSIGEVDSALAFWRGTGVLVTAEREETASAAPEQAAAQATSAAPRVVAERGLPAYGTEELSAVLERRGELAHLIDDAQQAFGKVFNTAEIGIIAGLADYLGLDEEYILLLLTHCRNMGKRSLRYVEKMALTLHDEGIHEATDLEARLHNIELMASAIGRIKTIFGIGSRALTTKERGLVEQWVCTMHMSEEMIARAYEMTVDSTTKPSIPYANRIIERWHAEGYRTVADVEQALAEYRRLKAGGKSSFDVDEFFEAALKRTYGE